MEVVVKKWVSETIPLAELSQLFTEFYKGYPWYEYICCPICKAFDDFGPASVYGIEEHHEKHLDLCPICGARLELFWSEDRLSLYLFKINEMGEVIFIDGQLAAWWRGRKHDAGKTLYLDVIAIMPKFRRTPFRDAVVEYFQKEIVRYHVTGRAILYQ